MLKFEFVMGGIPAVVEAENKVDAMARANRFYRDMVEQGKIELTQGAWMDDMALESFYWAEGNFYD